MKKLVGTLLQWFSLVFLKILSLFLLVTCLVPGSAAKNKGKAECIGWKLYLAYGSHGIRSQTVNLVFNRQTCVCFKFLLIYYKCIDSFWSCKAVHLVQFLHIFSNYVAHYDFLFSFSFFNRKKYTLTLTRSL